MPTYAFLCPKGHGFEQAHSIKDIPAQVRCKCGETAKRVFVLPEGFLNSWTPPCTLPGRMCSSRTTGPHPQYGEYKNERDLIGKEEKSLDRMNSKQSRARWKIERGVRDGRGSWSRTRQPAKKPQRRGVRQSPGSAEFA